MARRRDRRPSRAELDAMTRPRTSIGEIMQLYSLISPERDLQVQMDQQKLADMAAMRDYATSQGYPSIEALAIAQQGRLKEQELQTQRDLGTAEIEGRKYVADSGVKQQQVANQPQGADIAPLTMILNQAAQNQDMATLQSLHSYNPGMAQPFIDQVSQVLATQKAGMDAARAADAAKGPVNSARNLGQTVTNVTQGNFGGIPEGLFNTVLDFSEGMSGTSLGTEVRSMLKPEMDKAFNQGVGQAGGSMLGTIPGMNLILPFIDPRLSNNVSQPSPETAGATAGAVAGGGAAGALNALFNNRR